jgi:hypothetical protein
MLASLCGFLLAEMVAPSPWSMVLFFMLALPYYLAALGVAVLSHSLGLSAGWTAVVGLAIAADVAVVFPLRRLATRGDQDR